MYNPASYTRHVTPAWCRHCRREAMRCAWHYKRIGEIALYRCAVRIAREWNRKYVSLTRVNRRIRELGGVA